MPEIPDITLYIEALKSRILGRTLTRVTVLQPFFLRTVEPAIADLEGRTVTGLRRIGKRIAIEFDNELWLVVHLMVAGRLQWKEKWQPNRGKSNLAAVVFSSGTLLITEAGSKKRASLHIVRAADLASHDPGGLEVFDSDEQQFKRALTRQNHTLRRALTDPRIFSGIGNAYSDEILHAARLSPVALSQKLRDDEIRRLYSATITTLQKWLALLREETGDKFPAKVTAFRPAMAVHGRFGEPCPVCDTPVQRIRYASNETNYCPRCQTNGRILADRSLSRLLKKDWPRMIEDLDAD